VKIKFVSLAAFLVFAIAAHAEEAPVSITLAGGASVGKLLQKAAADFGFKNQVGITTNIILVLKALECVKDRTCDIAMVNYDAEDHRVKAIPNVVAVHYGLDASSIVVHPTNEISTITIGQIQMIYTAKKKNWLEVGSKSNLKITLFARPSSEGGRSEDFLGVKEQGEPVIVHNTDEAVNRVSITPGGISVVGLAYARQMEKSGKVKILKLDGIEPTKENIRSKKYKYLRSLSLVYRSDSSKLEVIQKLIDHVMKERPSTFDQAGVVMQ
jgi:ABC-type phosphate transport system substrate-binding protein